MQLGTKILVCQHPTGEEIHILNNAKGNYFSKEGCHRNNHLQFFLQASECGAVKHCINAVWLKEKVPKDDDEVHKIINTTGSFQYQFLDIIKPAYI